jgi:L-galactose dehydrogenase
MKYKALGKTGLTLSVIGFGGAPLGNEFGGIDVAEGERAVHLAIERGINFFDTSPYYGRTLSETRLGEALKGKRQQVILSTKCGRYDTGSFDFSAARVASSVDESLQRLQTDYLDLLIAHDIEFGHREQVIEETVLAMRKLQQAGKVRAVGISGLPLKLLADVATRAKVDFVLSYCRYNPLIQDMDVHLTPVLEKQGIGLLNAAPVHLRLLTKEGALAKHPAPEAVKQAGKAIVEACLQKGIDPAVVALQFCVEHPYAASTCVGMMNRREVEKNLTALDAEVPADLLAQMARIAEPVKTMTWASGLPENQDA